MFDSFNVWKTIQEDEETRPLGIFADENKIAIIAISDEDTKTRIVISYKEFAEIVAFVEAAKKLKEEK